MRRGEKEGKERDFAIQWITPQMITEATSTMQNSTQAPHKVTGSWAIAAALPGSSAESWIVNRATAAPTGAASHQLPRWWLNLCCYNPDPHRKQFLCLFCQKQMELNSPITCSSSVAPVFQSPALSGCPDLPKHQWSNERVGKMFYFFFACLFLVFFKMLYL